MSVDDAIPILPQGPWQQECIDELNRADTNAFRQLVREFSARVTVTTTGIVCRDRRGASHDA